MKKLCNILAAIAFLLTLAACVDNNIGYDDVTNVPEGIYLSGTASEFSTEARKGILRPMQGDVLYTIDAWLKPDGDFRISYVGEDGLPVRHGNGGEVPGLTDGLKSYKLSKDAERGFKVDKEGLYQLILNKPLGEVNILPYDFRIKGMLEMTEDGSKNVPLNHVEYDRVNHIVTWTTGTAPQVIMPSEFTFIYGAGDKPAMVNYSDTERYTVPTTYTGPSGSLKTNQLSADFTDMTNHSAVNLNLRHKGNYMITLRYAVRTGKFAAKIEGEELIEPEPTGFPTSLYMAGDEFGGFGDDGMIRMAPVGVAGNGAFWTMQHFTAGKTIRWSTEMTGANSFATLGTNANYTVDAQGNASVNKSGDYVVFVDMARKLIAFEEPDLYAIGDCFGGGEVRMRPSNGQYTATTTSSGNLHMYATSLYNTRDWNTMEFNIYNGRIVYKGIGEQENVPVAAGVPIRLKLQGNTAELDVAMDPKKVPTSAERLYLIADNIGGMNWGATDVVSLWNTWNSRQVWFTIHYFKAGMGIRLSTDKRFGPGEFVQLDENAGFTVKNGKAVVDKDGIYMVYVDLSGRKLYIEPTTIYGYGTATGDLWNEHTAPFTNKGATARLKLRGDGRLRLDPTIPQVANSDDAWKRELWFDPSTGVMTVRKAGQPEPNRDYVWKSGTTVVLNFETMTGSVER